MATLPPVAYQYMKSQPNFFLQYPASYTSESLPTMGLNEHLAHDESGGPGLGTQDLIAPSGDGDDRADFMLGDDSDNDIGFSASTEPAPYAAPQQPQEIRVGGETAAEKEARRQARREKRQMMRMKKMEAQLEDKLEEVKEKEEEIIKKGETESAGQAPVTDPPKPGQGRSDVPQKEREGKVETMTPELPTDSSRPVTAPSASPPTVREPKIPVDLNEIDVTPQRTVTAAPQQGSTMQPPAAAPVGSPPQAEGSAPRGMIHTPKEVSRLEKNLSSRRLGNGPKADASGGGEGASVYSSNAGSEEHTNGVYAGQVPSTASGPTSSTQQVHQLMDHQMQKINEKFRRGDLRAFGNNEQSIFDDVEAIRQNQIQVFLEHLELELRPSSLFNDNEDDFTANFHRAAKSFEQKEREIVPLTTKLAHLAKTMDKVNAKVAESHANL